MAGFRRYLLALVALALAVVTRSETIEGTLAVLVNMTSADATFTYRVFGDDGNDYLLDLTGEPTLPTGMRVRATGVPTAGLAATSFLPFATHSIEAVGLAGAQVAALGTAPRTLKVLMVLITMCGQSPPLTTTTGASLLFKNSANLNNWYSSCSRGQASIDSGSKVVQVTLGCSGTTSTGKAWTSTMCDDYTYATAALEEVKRTMTATQLATYPHKAFVYNVGNPCYANGAGTYALGEYGCYSFTSRGCYSWYSSAAGTQVQAYAHELGHNLQLAHGSRGTSEYSDYSSAMGLCCNSRCYNAPQMWQLGWNKELTAIVNSATLPAGTTRTFALPALDTATNAIIRVVADFLGDATPQVYWISFRTSGGFNGIDDLGTISGTQWGDRVLIHSYANAAAGTAIADYRTYANSYYQAGLHPGFTSSWAERGLVVRVRALTTSAPAAATVTICRKAGATETMAQCFDGLDNDCDGLVDSADPDCRRAPSRSPSPKRTTAREKQRASASPSSRKRPSPKRSPPKRSSPKRSPPKPGPTRRSSPKRPSTKRAPTKQSPHLKGSAAAAKRASPKRSPRKHTAATVTRSPPKRGA